MSLDLQAKEKIYSRVRELVTRKHFDPGMNGANWEELSKARKDQILRSRTDQEFEKQIQDVLSELKTSHTGFRHSKSPNIPGRHAIAATFMRCNLDGGERWMFQDVHEGGPAYAAGLRPGDILLEVDGQSVRPPTLPTFNLGIDCEFTIEGGGGQIHRTPIVLPKADPSRRNGGK